MSIEKIYLRQINPVLPTAFGDELSYYEAICKLQHKINECISLIEELDVTEIRQEIEDMRNELRSSISTINQKLDNELNRVRAELDSAILNEKQYVNAQLALYLLESKNYVDNAIEEFRQQLPELTKITVYDPTTGLMTNVQTALNNIYDQTREKAFTASEFDDLELTVTEFESYDMTASQFDRNAKDIITGV